MQFMFIKSTIYLFGDEIKVLLLVMFYLTNVKVLNWFTLVLFCIYIYLLFILFIYTANAQAKSIPTKRKQNVQSTNKKQSKKKNAIDSNIEDKAPVKRKQNIKKRSKKSIVINSDTEEDDDKENELALRFDELEYKE